jgi:PAS domain S-box-containing protein
VQVYHFRNQGGCSDRNMNYLATPPAPQRGSRSHSSVRVRPGWIQERRCLNAYLWHKSVADQTTKVRTAPHRRRRGAGAEAKIERLQGEARRDREALARLPRWFGALVTILARAVPARLRHISQVLGWPPSSLPPLLRGVVVAVCYFVFAKVSLTLASLHPSASPVWPPSGLALASLLLWGNGLWPAVAAGAFVANATTFGSLSTSALIAAGNTLEALMTAALLKHLKASTQLFEDPPQVVLFVFLTLLPGTMISATMGVGSLVLAGYAEPAKFASIWLTWWLGDVGGKLLVTPFLMLWANSGLKGMGRAELQRLAQLLGLTLIVGLVAFSPLLQQTTARGPLGFVAIGPLLWAALRYNQRDTATVALMLSAFAIWGTLSDGGPFARPNLNDSFLLTMAFVISTAVPSLVLSADVAARRHSEERHRALVEHASDIVATLDLDLRFTSVNPAIERILGFAPAKVVGTSLRQPVPHEQRQTYAEMLDRKLQGEPSTQYEVEILTKAGARRILEVSSKLIADATGKPIAIHAIARDITERREAKQAEAQVAELDHRVKNVLATVIAVSQRTRDGRTSMDDFLSAFDGRIQSMADAHSLLSGGRWQGVNLAQLVHQELAPCMAPLNTVVDGPDIVLAPDATQPVALVLHELVTNAAKYGALSSPKGHVSVEWRQQMSGHAPGTLLLDWKETGGPPIPASISPGYGTSVIKELIPYELGGAVDLVFAPEGVRCRLEIPQKWLKDANRPFS